MKPSQPTKDSTRAGESEVPRRRSPRFFNRGRQWYVRTREGEPIGPFPRLSEAVLCARNYVEYLRRSEQLVRGISGR